MNLQGPKPKECNPSASRLLRWAFNGAAVLSAHFSFGSLAALTGMLATLGAFGALCCLVKAYWWSWEIEPYFPPYPVESIPIIQHAQRMIGLWLSLAAFVSLVTVCGRISRGRLRWDRAAAVGHMAVDGRSKVTESQGVGRAI
jgi:hypothetical protein